MFFWEAATFLFLSNAQNKCCFMQKPQKKGSTRKAQVCVYIYISLCMYVCILCICNVYNIHKSGVYILFYTCRDVPQCASKIPGGTKSQSPLKPPPCKMIIYKLGWIETIPKWQILVLRFALAHSSKMFLLFYFFLVFLHFKKIKKSPVSPRYVRINAGIEGRKICIAVVISSCGDLEISKW